jgi:tetratricopeptide (TPR) repeat protein
MAVLLVTAGAAAQTGPQGRLQIQLRRAESLERAGQYSRALTELDRLLEEWPAQPGAVLAYERIGRRQGRLAKVLPVVERAIETDPRSALLRQVQLRVLADLGRADELRDAGDRWLQLAPRSEMAYRAYASALRRVGATRDAETLLRAGQGRVDRPEDLASALADLYLAQRRWSDAAGQWLFLVARTPQVAWELINYKLQALGPDADRAAAAILARLPDDPASVEEWELAALAALYAGREGEARERAEAVLARLDVRGRRAFVLRFAKVADARRQPALVAWAYRRMLGELAADSTRWVLARQIVGYDLSAGDTVTAMSTLEELLDRSKTMSPAHRWASGLQVRLLAARGAGDRAERALERYEKLYGADRDLAVLALAVARADMRRGRLDRAAEILDRVPAGAARGVTGARLSASRAYLALYAGRYDEARAALELAAAALTGAERNDAIRFLGLLRDGNEAELSAMASAHRALLEGERLKAFERLMEGLRDAPPSGARAGLLLWAGELAVEAGVPARAEAVLRRIPELYPGSGAAPVSLMKLAEALTAVGRRSDAIEVLERLILDYPESGLTPLGRRRLAELRGEVPRS